MPFRSEAQRKWMFANHPDMAAEWQAETPKGTKLPKKVKKAFDLGVSAACRRFKLAGEEIRLKIPKGKGFHGLDGAFGAAATKNQKAAGHNDEDMHEPLEPQADEGQPVERLTAILQQLDAPGGPFDPNAKKDPLDRSTMWGPPSNAAGGEAGGRAEQMGQSSDAGKVF